MLGILLPIVEFPSFQSIQSTILVLKRKNQFGVRKIRYSRGIKRHTRDCLDQLLKIKDTYVGASHLSEKQNYVFILFSLSMSLKTERLVL